MPIDTSEAPSIARSLRLGGPADCKQFAAILDSILLRPDATNAIVEQVARDAAEHGFHTIVLSPAHVAQAAAILKETPVQITAVVGFPFGANTTATKRFEALDAIRLGARHIETLMNLSALKSGDRGRVETDIKALVEIVHAHNASLTICLEVALLSLEEKIFACQLALAAGADAVSSSLGLNSASPASSDISLMRGVAGEKLGVKASIIDSMDQAFSLLDAGATRLGTAHAAEIMRAVLNASS
jgi:deoxyribose-phosphate aldolase